MYDPLDIYSKDLKLNIDTKEKTIMSLNQNNSMTFYHLMPGVDVVYNNFNIHNCIEPYYKKYTMNVIEINHCISGRYGCTIDKNRQVFLGEGEIEINVLGIKRIHPEFPLGFYNGIAIIIDIPTAKKYFHIFFPEIEEQVDNLKESLSKNNNAYLVRKTKDLINKFNELVAYKKQENIQYMKLKVLELLLMFQTTPLDTNMKDNKYFCKLDIDKIKCIHKDIIHNLDKKFTINDFSVIYNISPTQLKNCFKEVYGVPFYTYIKKYKMHKAIHLLEETNLSITDIAGQLAYDNASKFISAFKAVVGKTPNAYRKENVRLEHCSFIGVEIE